MTQVDDICRQLDPGLRRDDERKKAAMTRQNADAFLFTPSTVYDGSPTQASPTATQLAPRRGPIGAESAVASCAAVGPTNF